MYYGIYLMSQVLTIIFYMKLTTCKKNNIIKNTLIEFHRSSFE